jgi:hypothetical protein
VVVAVIVLVVCADDESHPWVNAALVTDFFIFPEAGCCRGTTRRDEQIVCARRLGSENSIRELSAFRRWYLIAGGLVQGVNEPAAELLPRG